MSLKEQMKEYEDSQYALITFHAEDKDEYAECDINNLSALQAVQAAASILMNIQEIDPSFTSLALISKLTELLENARVNDECSKES